MIARYTRPAMGRIWSDENKYRCWLAVEVAASQALARFGLVPQPAADAIPARANFTVARINEIEAEVRHDVIAFTTTVAEHIETAHPEEKPPAGSTTASPPPTSSTPRSPSSSAKPPRSSAPASSHSPKP